MSDTPRAGAIGEGLRSPTVFTDSVHSGRIPVNVWSQIFTIYKMETQMSWIESTWGEIVCEPGNFTVRCLLVQVCRQWRKILLGEPGWWSDIVWGKDGMNEAETMMCLERSLTHPLKLVWMDPENLVNYRAMEDWRGKVLVENLARWEAIDMGAGRDEYQGTL